MKLQTVCVCVFISLKQFSVNVIIIKFNWIDFVREFMVLIVKIAGLNRLIVIVANHHFYISSIIVCGMDLCPLKMVQTTEPIKTQPFEQTHTC